jgi:beta-glucanase (GH16 family)
MVTLAIAMSLYQGRTLIFSDEFDKPGRPDPAKWTYEQGFVRNRELQWYQPQNAWVEGGKLIIEGRRERVKNPRYEPGSSSWQRQREYAEYTSASLMTRGLFSAQYGRWEIRAKIDARKGLWPAIWTLGVEGPWPSNGEIDLLEFYQDTILANTCYGTGQGIWNTGKRSLKHFTDRDPRWAEKFHTWRMDWDEGWIKLYIDDEFINQTNITGTRNPDGKNPFHQPHCLLLNLAIGSNGGDPSLTSFPSRYEIDWVRIYK